MPDFQILLLGEPVMAVAYVIFGMVGFGSTLIAAPLLAHVLPITTVVPTLALTDLVASWSNGWRMSSHVDRRELFRLVPAMLIGNAIGAWVLFTLPLQLLMALLGVFVVLYALNGLRAQRPKAHFPARWAWWYGTVGGVFSALFGVGGWVYSAYLVRRLDAPQQIRATQTAVLMVSSCIRVGLFMLAGRILKADLLLLVLALLPAVGLGLYAAHHINLRLDRRRFMQVLHGVLLLSGSSLLIRALFAGS